MAHGAILRVEDAVCSRLRSPVLKVTVATHTNLHLT